MQIRATQTYASRRSAVLADNIYRPHSLWRLKLVFPCLPVAETLWTLQLPLRSR